VGEEKSQPTVKQLTGFWISASQSKSRTAPQFKGLAVTISKSCIYTLMKKLLLPILLLFVFALRAQYCQYDYTEDKQRGNLSEDILTAMRTHRVRVLTYESPNIYCFYEDEYTTRTVQWEFSATGKLIAYRSYNSTTDQCDPYPTLPKMVALSPVDTIYYTERNGSPAAYCMNYHFLSKHGIWRRSYYIEEYSKRYAHANNEMQYAYDGDSNLIFYRSQMDHVAPQSYLALDLLIRYDTLGDAIERIRYGIFASEASNVSWFPHFDTTYYERITYDYETREEVHVGWTKENNFSRNRVDDYKTECDACVATTIQPISWRYPTEIVCAVPALSHRERRKQNRYYRKHPAVTFSGNCAIIAEKYYSVVYW
jgi:hypothetical protein